MFLEISQNSQEKTWAGIRLTDESGTQHCVKSVRIRSYSGPYFPAFGLNTDQTNSEYGVFSRSAEHVWATASISFKLAKSRNNR